MKKNFWNGIIVVLLIVIVVMVWVSSPGLMAALCGWMGAKGAACPADFGETFVALDALFSGLAFLGIILLLISQRKEFARASIEAGEKYDKQVETMILHGFESTFFHMFTLYKDAVASTAFTVKNYEGTWDYTGLQAFDELKKIGYYDEYYKRYSSHFQIYLRTVYQILNYIRISHIENKHFYAALFRTQLSDSELHFLFFNCLQEHTQGKLKALVEEYSIFEHIDPYTVWPPLLIEYSVKAFGENPTLCEMYAEEKERHAMLEPATSQPDIHFFSDL
ncbi:putative phage abortive infection protein [Desulfococcaceae bacterium OttesenSCG-928-F15]|nr:putative phage abortive infection protein [Desulfococcaceae bacterium OttesenSCG-928-F15]